MSTDTSMPNNVGQSHVFCQAEFVGAAHTRFFRAFYEKGMDPLPALSGLPSLLKDLRKRKKLSQVEVAVEIGVDRATISKYETGGDIPGRDTLFKLARFYGVPIDWLAAKSGEPLTLPPAVQTEDEALIIWAYRTLPKEEAAKYLELLVTRAKAIRPAS